MNDYLKAVPVESDVPPAPAEAACIGAARWLAHALTDTPLLLAPPQPAGAPDAASADHPTADDTTTEAHDAPPGEAPDEAKPVVPILASIDVFGVADPVPWPPFEADLLLCDATLTPPQTDCPVEALPATLPELDARLAAAGELRVALAVAGDPLSNGPGRRLLAALGPDRVRLHAAVGPLQTALARVGFGIADVQVLDMAQLGPDGVLARLRRGRLYALCPGHHGTQAAGRLLERAGLHQARVWRIAADPGTPVEALLAFELRDRPAPDPDRSFVLAYTAGADGSSRDWPGIAADGDDTALPEAARLLALAWLQPGEDEYGWSIEGEEPLLALDWSRERPEARIHCVGSDPARLADLVRIHLGGQGIAAMPDGSFRGLESLPDPNVVFLRAGPEFTQQVRTAWDRLRPAGRMVVAAESEQARLELMQFAHRQRPALWQDLAVSHGDGATRFELGAARCVRLMGWRKAARG
ncbi:MAG: hypothetical protein KDG52_00675 [Rhodocyclaceae bacterium]|nr:hypothetical protein [Rhodocyclaceae bacterium]